jgi:hypothetical protein
MTQINQSTRAQSTHRPDIIACGAASNNAAISGRDREWFNNAITQHRIRRSAGRRRNREAKG